MIILDIFYQNFDKFTTKKINDVFLSNLTQTYPDLKYFKINKNLDSLMSFNLRTDNTDRFLKFNFNSNIILNRDSTSEYIGSITIIASNGALFFGKFSIRIIDNKYWIYFRILRGNGHGGWSKVSEIKKIENKNMIGFIGF